MQRVPSRIPISVINPYHHERERDRISYHHERERARIEYPTRDKDRSQFGKDVDARFLENITNRIKSSYSCNQKFCPMIKQRLDHHQRERHSSNLRTNGHTSDDNADSRTISTPPLAARNCTSTKCGPVFKGSHSIQTYVNGISNTSNETSLHDNDNWNNNATELDNTHNSNNNVSEGIQLKRTETRELVTPKRNIYKDYLQKEVTEWFQEIPIYPERGHNCDKDGIIHELTDKINDLFNESNNDGYDRKITVIIGSSLNGVPMWYLGAKRDQDLFKNSLTDNLLNRIKDLNQNMLIKNTNHSYNDSRVRARRSSYKHSQNNFNEIEEEICNWLSKINFSKSSGLQIAVNKKDMAKALMKRVAPLLKKPMSTCHYKANLKSAIFDVLNDLPIDGNCSRVMNIQIHRFSEDLARLLSIQAKLEHKSRSTSTHNAMYLTNEILGLNTTQLDFEKELEREIIKFLADTKFNHNNDVKNKITNIIMDYVDSSDLVKKFGVVKEITDVFRCASTIPEFLASNIAQNLIRKVSYALNLPINEVSNIKPKITRKISVYTSEENIGTMNYPVTSTPNKKKLVKFISKLNPEEIEYEQKLGSLIRAWMETLPEQFNDPEEKDFKETIIKDLAGEISDEAKLEQLASVDDREKWLIYVVYKWLQKLDVFDLQEVAPYVHDLLNRVADIPIPILTRPQGGNRQAMANIKHMDSELAWKEIFLPKGKDILEDEISIWMNEQPSEIFDTDLNTRNNKIHELAEVLLNKLIKTRPETEILNDVEQWMSNIVKPAQRTNVHELADDLKDRVINLPQDNTLAAKHDKRVQQRSENLEPQENPVSQSSKPIICDNDTVNLDNTMQQFIAKFIEHSYDVEDPMARGAFSHLLKMKLQILNPPTRKEIYDNFDKAQTNEHLSREKLTKELQYIKDISDWLKNIPIESSYNTVGNRERIDFINNLAMNIYEVEGQREDNPDAMDYNMYMASIISQFIIQLPIIEEFRNDKNMNFMMSQLIGKIIVHRNKFAQTCDSIDTSGVHSQNIGDFIEEFIRINGSEIADDELKLEAWSVRLLTEIKNMIRENTDPGLLSKAQVYNRLTNVPLTGDKSIKQFESEFEYIKEISEWLKNLPLLPLEKTDEEERIRMICVLTEKITEREIIKSKNHNDKDADAEFAKYVSKWISDLALDESHEVVAAVVIQQLINRIERVKTRQKTPDLDFTQVIKNYKPTENNNPEIVIKQSSKTIKDGKKNQTKNPATTIVDAIDQWSASLPIKADDEETVNSLKADAAKKLYQTVGELSIDPRTFNDDLLYQDVLADEVDALIERLPETPELDNNKDKLKTEIVQNIVDAQKANKEKCAGKLYKQKLEHTIEASIPHPVTTRQAYDPGFEIYKSRLADQFILENYDHANDAVKVKYERRIKDEIDKYYDSVKNKNAVALTKDEIYTELYSVLFKVPIPNESSLAAEVEEIKTRCEIDAWFEKLPLKEADGIIELLERDKILATLAKRIRDIEKNESKSADIRKEIMKWLVKLPLLPCQENNVEIFANKLQNILKSSVKQRQCVVTDQISTCGKRKKGKAKVKSNENINVEKDASQVPGTSTDGKMWKSQKEHLQPKKKAAEIIIEIVEAWCNQLPIHAITPQEEETAKMIREKIYTKIIIKISELNTHSDTFNDDLLYDDLLDEELDKVLSVLPTCGNFEQSKPARKIQLIHAVQSVKPLFREEKERQQYKQELNQTVIKVLVKSRDTNAAKEALFHELKDEIVEDFIQYHYDLYDDESRKVFKIAIHDAVVKFLTSMAESKYETMTPLMRRNQLLCELAMIPAPTEVGLREEVEEIRMKKEISELFDNLSISDTDKDRNKLINLVKSSLAKKLNDIELNGHNPESDAKMKQEIARSLKKINKEVKQGVVDDFVNKLKKNEMVRRAPRKEKAETPCQNYCKTTEICGKNTPHVQNKSKPISQTSEKSITKNQSFSKNNIGKSNSGIMRPNSQNSRDEYGGSQHIHEMLDSKAHIECDCPRNEFPQYDDSQLIHDVSDTKAHMKFECPRTEILQKERPESPENLEDDDEPENYEERCICGRMRRGRIPCYLPMNCFYGPEIIPVCGPPAGFFYY